MCKGLRTAGFSNSPDGKQTESLPVMQLQELTLELDEGVEERDQMQNPRIQGLLKPGIGPVVSPRTKTLKWGGTAGSPRPLGQTAPRLLIFRLPTDTVVCSTAHCMDLLNCITYGCLAVHQVQFSLAFFVNFAMESMLELACPPCTKDLLRQTTNVCWS